MPFSITHDETAYTVKRSKRRSLGLYVRNNIVEVRAPHFVDNHTIQQWVQSKSDWIQERLQEQEQQHEERPQIRQGGSLLFMGQKRDIVIAAGQNQVIESDQQIIIYSSDVNDQAKHQTILEKWLKQEAQHYINERCLELANIMQIQDEINGIKYRKTKSKWGHCTSDGILQFNWLIIMAPVEVIDYLLIHELSHLTFMNHSKEFWQRVKCFSPQYKEHKAWLHHQGHKISL